MSDVFLSPQLRANLLAIAETTRGIDRASLQLSTGRRINLPGEEIDAYLRASQLELDAARARDPLDELALAAGAINAALAGTSAIRRTIQQIQALVTQARNTAPFATFDNAANGFFDTAADPARVRTFETLAIEYDRLLAQITSIAEDSSFNGINLIGDADTTNTYFYQDTTSALQIGPSSTYLVQGFYLGNPIVTYDPAALGTLYTTDPYTGSGQRTQQRAGGAPITIGNDRVGATGVFNISAGNDFNTTRSENRTLPNGTVLYGYQGTNAAARTAQLRIDQIAGGEVTTLGAFNVNIADIGLGLLSSIFLDGLATTAGQQQAQISIDRALQRLSAVETQLGVSAAFIEARTEFQEGIAAEYDAGRSKLVDADVNRVGAELTALRTLQGLGVQATNSRQSAANGVLTLLQSLNGN